MLQRRLFDSIADYLERFFETDYVKGPMAYGAMSGSATRALRTPGTAFSQVLPHRGRSRRAASALGRSSKAGWARSPRRSPRALQSYGGEIRLEAPVARSAASAAGRPVSCWTTARRSTPTAVLSNADPKTTLLELTPAEALHDGCSARKVGRIKARAPASRSTSPCRSCPTSRRCRARRSARSIAAAS